MLYFESDRRTPEKAMTKRIRLFRLNSADYPIQHKGVNSTDGQEYALGDGASNSFQSRE
jgi:hypothetical protein